MAKTPCKYCPKKKCKGCPAKPVVKEGTSEEA